VDPLAKLEAPAELRRAGAWDKAASQLDGLIAAEAPRPSAPTALALGALRLEMGDFKAAEAPIQCAASAATPLRPYAVLLLAECLHAQGRDADAWPLLKSLSLPGPSPVFAARALRLRAQVLRGLHRFSEETAVWREIASGPTSRGSGEAAFFRLGQALESAEQAQAALQAYEAIYYGRLQSPYVHPAALAIARLKAAGKVRARSLGPGEALAFAEKLLRYGHAEDALALVENIQPGSLKGEQARGASFLKVSCLYVLRDNAGTVAEADALWAAWGNHPVSLMAQLKAGWALVRTGDQAGVQERVRRILDGAGKDESLKAQAHSLAGTSAYVKGRFPEALESFRAIETLKADAGTAASGLYKKAWCLFALKDYAGARAVFLQVAERFRGDGYREPSLYWAGRCALFTGDLEVGAGEFRILADSGPGFWSHRAGAFLAASAAALLPAVQREAVPARWAPELKIPETSLARTLDLCGLEEEASYAFEPFYKKHKKDNAAALAFALFCSDAGRMRDARGALARRFGPFKASTETPVFLLKALYPAPSLGLIRKTAGDTAVPAPLLLALIRNESGFDEDSFSPAGAVGLMQLVPRTAQTVSKGMGLEPPSPDALAEPATNLKLGAQYLAGLLKQFPEAEAVASYNAGEDAVSAWMTAFAPKEAEQFIGMVPYLETRAYVARVLWDEEIYRRIYP